ncbi:MAG: hypothetical protein J2P19_03450 [Pseudonocardia sp.]|nr:hypothetical protein [Pseudonocardia sp.]
MPRVTLRPAAQRREIAVDDDLPVAGFHAGCGTVLLIGEGTHIAPTTFDGWLPAQQ